ncbi:MAG: hypothetical protein NUV60_02915 [Patescibacteria group bacterium]|nr:hypothetical protein [Patescibacteria group bacterium]
MSHKRLWTAATIIALVVVAGFFISVPHTRDLKTDSLPDVVAVTPEVIVHDSFKKGEHTITGSVLVPNACIVVTTQASLVGDASDPSGIALEISYPTDSGVCLQVPTKMNFKTNISAPARLPFTATVNGVSATTTAS